MENNVPQIITGHCKRENVNELYDAATAARLFLCSSPSSESLLFSTIRDKSRVGVRTIATLDQSVLPATYQVQD